MLFRAAGGMPFDGGLLMQQNRVFSLRPVLASQRIPGSACAEADVRATYGCVDWYLYQNAPPTPAESGGRATTPAVAAPCSSLIERAAAAAGATVTAVTAATQRVSSAEACVW